MSMDDLRNLLSDDEYAGLEEYLSESENVSEKFTGYRLSRFEILAGR